MLRGRRLQTVVFEFFRDLGPSGSLLLLGICLLVALLPTIFMSIRPPTVDQVETDLLNTWIEVSTAASGETLPGLLVSENKATCEQLLTTLGESIDAGGNHIIPTAILFMRVKDSDGNVFAEWSSTQHDESEGYWKFRSLVLYDRQLGPVGELEMRYKFYRSGLEYLPTIRHLKGNYSNVRWLVAFLAILILIAVFSNLTLMRERAARLQSQQVTLDLARQMCHELRNGLWAFSLEGKNIRQLLDMIDQYLQAEGECLDRAAEKLRLDTKQRKRLVHTYHRMLAEQNLDPLADLQPTNDMAKEAHQQVESFSRYINLTVEELDRNLLGGASSWTPQRVRLTDAWLEACDLLNMRFRSAGVVHHEKIQTQDDWVLGDPRALVHIFVNLTKNAIEAMREQSGPRVLTFQVCREKTIVCTVHNTGVPIAEEHLPLIFRSGFSTKQGAGRGTGLALVQDSVRRMGGTVSVESSPERGTTFRLEFEESPPE